MLTADFDRLNLKAHERVLDLGAGFGRHAFAALRLGADVVAIDSGLAEMQSVQAMFGAMHAAGELAEDSQAGSIQGDLLALPFDKETFDVVMCSEVMEHIADEVGAIRELSRVVTPNGRIVITVPRAWPERINWALSDEYHNVPGGHIRIYSRRHLSELVESAGFRIEGFGHAHGLHTPYWWLKCLVGTTRDDHWAVKIFHRFLVWDIMKRPRTTRFLEALLSPIMGKSIVLYATKVEGQ